MKEVKSWRNLVSFSSDRTAKNFRINKISDRLSACHRKSGNKSFSLHGQVSPMLLKLFISKRNVFCSSCKCDKTTKPCTVGSIFCPAMLDDGAGKSEGNSFQLFIVSSNYTTLFSLLLLPCPPRQKTFASSPNEV